MTSHTLLSGFAIILFLQFISTWIVGALHISFPPALLGMIFLVILLLTKKLKIAQVDDMSTLLMEKMGMFFAPGAVSLLLYMDILKKEWLAIFATVFISTIIVIVVTGLFLETMLKRKERKNA